MSVAVLGPGGVGGYVAGALARAGTPVTIVAREGTAGRIARDGLRVDSVRLGSFVVHPPAVSTLDAPVDVLVVAVKAPALEASLARVGVQPRLVVPLLNGFEHMTRLRDRFTGPVAAGSIRIAVHRPRPGHVVHTSAAVRVDLAPPGVADELCHALRSAEVPAVVREREADVLWGKLARLCPLALTTAASGEPIGRVRSHPRWRLRLADAVDEVTAVARAEGAGVEASTVLDELARIAPDQTTSLARDVAEGAPSELDAIGGAVLRAAARRGIACPAVSRLVLEVAQQVR